MAEAIEAAAPPAAVLRGGAGANEGSAYTVQLSATGTGAATISKWTIDWGDGTSNTLAGDATSAAHVSPAGPAAHRIAATVTNDDGTWPVVVAVPDVAAAPDPSFGLNGYASAHYQYNFVRPPIVALPNGKTVVAGQSRSTETGRHWTIHQLTGTGQDDPAFGFQGTLHLTFNDSYTGTPSAMVAQPDGKLIVAGSRSMSTTGSTRWTILRMHADGQQDDTFGTAGRVLEAPGAAGVPSNVQAVALQPDGRLLVLGTINDTYVLARYFANGTPDPSFGTSGSGVVNLTAATAALQNGMRVPSMVALQSDGRIIVGGWGDPFTKRALVAVRLSSAGAFDPTFGSSGFAVAEFNTHVSSATGLAVDAQNRVVLTGPLFADPWSYWGVARFTANGIDDANFGAGNGRFVTDFAAAPTFPVDLLMNADSSFWLGGTSYERKQAVARVTADGRYDAALDNDGYWIANRAGSVYRLAQTPGDATRLLATVGDTSVNPIVQEVTRFRWGGGGGVTVNDVQPTVVMAAARWTPVNGTFQPAFSITDPGQDAVSNWFVEWRDGTSDTYAPGDIAAASHVYTSTGAHGLRVTITNEDGTYVRTLPIVVLDNPPVQNGVLRLPGSSVTNFFQINAAPGVENVGRFTLGGATFDFPLAGVSRILIDGAGGNDQVQVGGGVFGVGGVAPVIAFAPSSGNYSVMQFAPMTVDATSTPDGAKVSLNVNDTLRIDGSARLDQLYVAYGRVDVTAGRGTVLRVNRFDYYGGGFNSYFDLHDNDMIIDYAPGQSSPLGTRQGNGYTFGSVLELLQRAHNRGAWNGPGIRSSAAAGDSGLYALGAADASHVLGLSGTATEQWSGQIVDATSVLVKYTYAGDANLDGIISGDDYASIDGNVSVAGASGWFNGDFNYDGLISGDDYAAIDANIASQGAPL